MDTKNPFQDFFFMQAYLKLSEKHKMLVQTLFANRDLLRDSEMLSMMVITEEGHYHIAYNPGKDSNQSTLIIMHQNKDAIRGNSPDQMIVDEMVNIPNFNYDGLHIMSGGTNDATLIDSLSGYLVDAEKQILADTKTKAKLPWYHGKRRF